MTDLNAILEQCLEASFEAPDFDPRPIFAAHPDHEKELLVRWKTLTQMGLVGEASSAERDLAGEPPESPAAGLAPELPDEPLGGRYRCKGELGRGGMGRVLLADDLHLDREVAVKLIDLETATPELKRRLLREACLHARLEHPGIAPVHDMGVEGGRYAYMVMKRVRGQTLAQLLGAGVSASEGTPGPIALERAVEIMIRLCDSLGFAHDQGVVHRDLKPSNVMVGNFGEVQLMDWGVARSGRMEPAPELPNVEATGAPWTATESGYIIGSPPYMAPEQARGGSDEQVDHHTDIFGLGALLHHLLTGSPPYWGSDRSEVLSRAEEGRRNDPGLTESKRAVPKELAAICRRALEPKKEDRYASTVELKEDLEAFLTRSPGRAWNDGPRARFTKWVARRPGWAASLAGLTAAALLAGFLLSETTARATAERTSLYLRLNKYPTEVMELVARERIEEQDFAYDLAALDLTAWLDDQGIDLFDPQSVQARVAEIRGDTGVGAEEALVGITRVYRRVAELLSMAGAPEAISRRSSPTAEPIEGAERVGEELERIRRKVLTRSPQIVELWAAVDEISPTFNRDEWSRRTWEYLKALSSSKTDPDLMEEFAVLMRTVDPSKPSDVDWITKLRGRGGNTLRFETEQLCRAQPDSAPAHAIVATVRMNDAGYYLQTNPDEKWSALRRSRHAETYARSALSLAPSSSWARLNHAAALGGVADNYRRVALECDQHVMADEERGLTGASSTRMKRLATEYRRASLDFRNRQVLAIRQDVQDFDRPQAKIQLVQAMGSLIEDERLHYDGPTKGELVPRGIDLPAFRLEARELCEEIGLLLGTSAKARTLSGILYLCEGDSRVVEECRAALAIDSNYGQAKECLITWYTRQFERHKGQADLDQALLMLEPFWPQDPGQLWHRSTRIQLLEPAVLLFPTEWRYRLILAQDLIDRSDGGRRPGDLDAAVDLLKELQAVGHERERCTQILEGLGR